MRARAPYLLPALLCVACSGSPRELAHPVAVAPARVGAVLLASSGAAPAVVVGGSASDVVRGRVRWHLDVDGGATRSRTVTASPTTTALALPPWLDGGRRGGSGSTLLVTDNGLVLDRDGELRTLVHGVFASPSIGAHEIWLHQRTVAGDWLRFDPSRATITQENPPIVAPLLTPWSSKSTGGPEFVTPTLAYAIADLLGPIVTTDGGEHWSPVAPASFTSLGARGPTQIVRDPFVALATEDHALTLTSAGVGASSVEWRREAATLPDAAALRFEHLAPGAIHQRDGTYLFADEARIAVATIPMTSSPARIVRVSHLPDVTRCELSPAPARDLATRALAFCVREDDAPMATGAQLVAGRIVDGPAAIDGVSSLRFVAEQVFPGGVAHRASSSGAMAVGIGCNGHRELAVDFVSAQHACVRDDGGVWHDLDLGHVEVRGRVAASPMIDGRLAIVQEQSRGGADHHFELSVVADSKPEPSVAVARWQADATTSHGAAELLGFDEGSANRFTFVRRRDGEGPKPTTTSIESIAIQLLAGDASVVVPQRSPDLPADAILGVWADHAIAVAISRSPAARGKAPDVRVESLWMTSDGGAHWDRAEWPASAPPLDVDPAARRAECGPSGCRVLGWSRIGWYLDVASADVVAEDATSGEELPIASPPERARGLVATCTRTSPPVTIDASIVPLDHDAPRFSEVLVKVQRPITPTTPVSTSRGGERSIALSANRGAVRASFEVVGPSSAPWGDHARLMVHWSSDLDRLGVVFESTILGLGIPDEAVARSTSVSTYALGPGRILVAILQGGRCTALYRLAAGAPPERIDLTASGGPVGDIVRVINARELGGVLMVAGDALPRDTGSGAGVVTGMTTFAPMRFPVRISTSGTPLPFVALVTPSGVASTLLSRSGSADDGGFYGSVDVGRGRFGLLVASPLPTAKGGTTYLLPVDGTAHPADGFLSLVAGAADVARPIRRCSPHESAWDRGEQNRMRALDITITEATGAPTNVSLEGEGGSIRERVGETDTCLERATVIAPNGAFQFDPESGDALLMTVDTTTKRAFRQPLQCTLAWQ